MIYSTFYKISCKDEKIKDCYIGSTCNFNVRKWGHKSCSTKKTKKPDIYLYKFIKENGGWDNFKMEILERLDCKDKEEVRNNERHLIDFHKGTLNDNQPGRTKKQYKKEKLRDYDKKYSKKYNEKNKEDRAKYFKEYREENHEPIKQRWIENNIEYPCFCGKNIKKYNFIKHNKTKTHLKKIIKKLKPICEELKMKQIKTNI